MTYEAPLRCQQCGTVILKKPKAKTPKYCPPCRRTQQEGFRKQKRNRPRK